MKFKILKSDFLDALSMTQGIVDKKNVMPILANILIEAEEQMPFVKISATDLEVAVHVQVQAEIEIAGKITVNAKNIHNIVRESASDEIHINTTEGNRVEINSKQSEYKILGLDAKEFPNLPTIDGEMIRLPSDQVAEMFERVCFAMSADETRYHLNGILLEKDEKETVMVATDGHRLSYVKHALDLSRMKQNKIIIPRKGVVELRRMVVNEKSIDFCVSDRHIFIQTEKQTLFIRLIEGNYPDYNRVIPKENPISIEIPKNELLGALKRVSLLANDNTKGVSLYFCNDSLSLSTSNPEIGEAKEDIVLKYNGPVINIGFNARYFIDVLNIVPDDNIVISLKDELSPCLITSPSDVGFKSVIMPMRM
ncbi:MAG: DNA polymerase III subunit beta [bacterium]